MSKHKEATEIRFKQIQQIIDCALNDNTIQSHIKEFGYTTKKLDEGNLLYKKAYELYQKNFIAHHLGNPDKFQLLWDKANQYYLQLIHIGRLALQTERNDYIQLGLAGSRKTSLSGWLSQANQFYINVLSNPNVCKRLAEYGITQDKLETGKKLLDTVEVAIVSYSGNKEDIRNLSLEYDKAIDNMESWIYQFKTVSRIVLENKPQLLSKLQIEIR
ncbi:MAG: hypothetical protein KAS18_05805 [Calditrichia bacterium]|nr:hypothetical protein [Calditrichia bacterium]